MNIAVASRVVEVLLPAVRGLCDTLDATQSESLTMVSVQVVGNAAAIGFAASRGNFGLNVLKPVIVFNFLNFVRLLADGCDSFNEHCAGGIKPNHEHIADYVKNTLILVPPLNPHTSYNKAAKIAKKSHKEGTSLKDAALALGYLARRTSTDGCALRV